MPSPFPQPTKFHAICRKCNKLILLEPDNLVCPHCQHLNKVLEPDGRPPEPKKN